MKFCKKDRVKRLFKAAGGPAKVLEVLKVKNPSLDYKGVYNWYIRGSIPIKYYLDIVAMTTYSPSYVYPELYNVRHPAFSRFYKRLKDV